MRGEPQCEQAAIRVATARERRGRDIYLPLLFLRRDRVHDLEAGQSLVELPEGLPVLRGLSLQLAEEVGFPHHGLEAELRHHADERDRARPLAVEDHAPAQLHGTTPTALAPRATR